MSTIHDIYLGRFRPWAQFRQLAILILKHGSSAKLPKKNVLNTILGLYGTNDDITVLMNSDLEKQLQQLAAQSMPSFAPANKSAENHIVQAFSYLDWNLLIPQTISPSWLYLSFSLSFFFYMQCNLQFPLLIRFTLSSFLPALYLFSAYTSLCPSSLSNWNKISLFPHPTFYAYLFDDTEIRYHIMI